MALTKAETLQPGDRFRSFQQDTLVVVLREREPWTDRFNRPMIRFWCRREDTGAEGWMPFGPGGVVHTEPPGQRNG